MLTTYRSLHGDIHQNYTLRQSSEVRVMQVTADRGCSLITGSIAPRNFMLFHLLRPQQRQQMTGMLRDKARFTTPASGATRHDSYS